METETGQLDTRIPIWQVQTEPDQFKMVHHRHSENNSISDTTPLNFTPIQLSPSATSFTPNNKSVKRDSEQQIQGLTNKLNSSSVSMSYLYINSLTCKVSCASDNEYRQVTKLKIQFRR